MNSATLNPTEFLRALYLERRERNSSYSTRAFARDIGISQAYVSMILSGKKPLTIKQATRVAALLNIEPEKTEALLNAILGTATAKTKLKKEIRISFEKKEKKSWFVDLQMDRFAVISRWYHIAILDLTTTKTFRDDIQWIANRLAITPVEARDAIDRLVRLGFLERTKGKLKKPKAHLYFQTENSEPAVRKFHKEMIEKAALKLDETSPEAFNKRSITGVTFAVDVKKLELAKQKIKDFQQEMSELLTEGNCSEVYQLNVQFFSLTGDVK